MIASYYISEILLCGSAWRPSHPLDNQPTVSP